MLRTIGVLTIIGAIILGVGFTAGWFTFGSETHAGETEMTFRVDREEVREDVDDVKSRVTKDEVVANSPTEFTPPMGTTEGLMTGEVLSVEPSSSKLKLRLVTGDERTLVVTADSAAGLYQLKPGDRVELKTSFEGDRVRIVSLRVL